MQDLWKTNYPGRALQRGNCIIRVNGATEKKIKITQPDPIPLPQYLGGRVHAEMKRGRNCTIIEATDSQSVEWVDFLLSLDH